MILNWLVQCGVGVKGPNGIKKQKQNSFISSKKESFLIPFFFPVLLQTLIRNTLRRLRNSTAMFFSNRNVGMHARNEPTRILVFLLKIFSSIPISASG